MPVMTFTAVLMARAMADVTITGSMDMYQDANVAMEWFQTQQVTTVSCTKMHAAWKLSHLNVVKTSTSTHVVNTVTITTTAATGGNTTVNCETVKTAVIQDASVSKGMSEIMNSNVCPKKKLAFQSAELMKFGTLKVGLAKRDFVVIGTPAATARTRTNIVRSSITH